MSVVSMITSAGKSERVVASCVFSLRVMIAFLHRIHIRIHEL